jgi:hypothetical protein
MMWRKARRRVPPDDWLAAVREENQCLQEFAESHELPTGMMRLLVNLDYAVKNGALLAEKDVPEWALEQVRRARR